MANNYLSAAKRLDELMLALMDKGQTIPAHAAEDLKTGRSLAGILLRQHDDAAAMKAQAILERVEMNLLSLAESTFGRESAEDWQKRIAEAYAQETGPESASASRFVTGVPKDAYWVRVQADYPSQADVAPETFGLTAVAQEDGYLLIYGRKEDVSAFLNEIRERIRK
ncbi:MAG: DUF2096 family protein [Clostridiales bacterium]|nr:DUF2096 family protein [Clostridiales bacterium]